MSNSTLILHADAKERRELARAGMANYDPLGMFHYILDCPYVRNEGELYSIVDVVNILSDSEQESRKVWNDTKARLLRDKPDMSDRIRHISFRLWEDKNGRRRKSDATDKGAMLTIIQSMNTPLANALQQAINDMLTQYPEEYRAQIVSEMGRPQGWAATRNRLDMIESGCTWVKDSELKYWER